MIRKQISAMLICLLMTVFSVPFVSAQRTDDYSKIREQAVKYENKKKRVKVEMRLGNSQKGYISRASADSFDLTDSKSGQVSTIPYRDVSLIKKSGGLSVATVATLAGLAAGGIIITSLLLIRCRNEGGCGGY